MIRPHRGVTDPNRDRWMVSYMDVLTILLIFFVAAAAQTTLPRPEPQKPPPPPPPARPVISETQRRLAPLGLEVKKDSRGLVISLPQTILFRSGDDAINAGARPIVERIAAVLREIPNKVALVGHADSVPIHNRRFKNNWELAAARSLRLLEMLARSGGIGESRLSVESLSSFEPRESDDTAEGRAGNRRVEIVILDEPTPP